MHLCHKDVCFTAPPRGCGSALCQAAVPAGAEHNTRQGFFHQLMDPKVAARLVK